MKKSDKNSSEIYYIYFLRCSDDSLYIGITSDIQHRIMAHLGVIKGGARYTKSHHVMKIEAAWKTDSKSAALRMECALKKLSHKRKLNLINEPGEICRKYAPKLSEYVYEECSRDFLDTVFESALKKTNKNRCRNI